MVGKGRDGGVGLDRGQGPLNSRHPNVCHPSHCSCCAAGSSSEDCDNRVQSTRALVTEQLLGKSMALGVGRGYMKRAGV